VNCLGKEIFWRPVAHPSLSSASASSSFAATAPSKSDLESAVAGLLEIKRENPEHERAIDCAFQLMTDQEFTTNFLSTALVDVRMQLKELFVDLDLNEEVSEAIKTMQGGILSGIIILALAQFRPEPTQTHDSPWALKEVVYAF